MEPWYKVAQPRKEVREGCSFNPDKFAIALEQLEGDFDRSDRTEIVAKVRDAEEIAKDEVWAGYRFVERLLDPDRYLRGTKSLNTCTENAHVDSQPYDKLDNAIRLRI